MKVLRLHPGRERSLLRHHPWVFESAIASGRADSGETVRVESASGDFLCWAAYSPQSKIRARAWSFDAAERIDSAFFAQRIRRAVAARAALPGCAASNALRLVHAESDGLPGLVVDRYGDVLVAQFGAAGVERHKAALADALLAATGCTLLYERSDASSRALEGLQPTTGWLRGGNAHTPTRHELREHHWRLSLDIATGHKTGFYLDQRDNRKRFFDWCAQRRPQRVLNTFCYSGGFSVAALAALQSVGALDGATQVISVDSSAPALALAQGNVALNGLSADACTWVDADVNAYLRQCLDQGARFDAIVLDPPKLAPTAAQADRAARAYKDLNRLALKLLAPGGFLFTFSCSGGIGVDLFHKIVASAGADAGVNAQVAERLGAAADHPMTLAFPEGEYLKGLVLVADAAV